MGPTSRLSIFTSAYGQQPNYAWEELAKDLTGLGLTEEAVPGTRSGHGEKYEVRGRLKGTSSRGAIVVTVWIVPAVGEPPRLVTAYPGAES